MLTHTTLLVRFHDAVAVWLNEEARRQGCSVDTVVYKALILYRERQPETPHSEPVPPGVTLPTVTLPATVHTPNTLRRPKKKQRHARRRT